MGIPDDYANAKQKVAITMYLQEKIIEMELFIFVRPSKFIAKITFHD